MSELINALIRAIAEDRQPGSPLFVLTAEQSSPEAQIKRGDLVVYAQTTPQLGQAVVWSAQTGAAQFGRAARSGQVRAGGKWQRPARLRGVIIATVTPFP
jgi:hypothetical protein